MNKLVLFDIDWTLLKPSRAHGLAFKEAFKKIYGVNTTFDNLNVQGWTDRKIIFETLKRAGLDERTIEAKLENAMLFMSWYFAGIIDKYHLEVMGGAKDLLEELKKRHVGLGVLTGNLESIAQEKLKRTYLSKYFTFSYSGDESQDRTELVRKAVADARRCGIEQRNIFIIGDTPLDIIAGKKSGVKTIGVATGSYFVNDLNKAGADLVVSNLYEIERIKKIILR